MQTKREHHYRSKLISISLLFFLIIGFQNCGGDFSNNQGQSGTSPFEGNKVQIQLSTKTESRSVSSFNSTSSEAVKVVVLVNEKARVQNQCGLFSSQHLPPSPSQEEVNQKILALYTYDLFLDKNYILTQLEADVAEDNCILGISNLQVLRGILNGEAQINSLVNNFLTSPEQAYQNLNTALSLESIIDKVNSEAQNLVVQSKQVKVAVLSSGLDLSSNEFAGAIDIAPGANYIEGNLPQDDHFAGTGAAALLIADRKTQPHVRGLVPNLVKVMPIRVMGAEDFSTKDFSHQNLRQFLKGVTTELDSLRELASDPTFPSDKIDIFITLIDSTASRVNTIERELDGIFQDGDRQDISQASESFMSVIVQMSQSVLDTADTSLITLVNDERDLFQGHSVSVESFNLDLVSQFLKVTREGLTEIQTALEDFKQTQPDHVIFSQLQEAWDLRTEVLNINETLNFTSQQRKSLASQTQEINQELEALHQEIEQLDLDAAQADKHLAKINELVDSAREEILDKAVLRTHSVSNSRLADAIIRSVNSGADVINVGVNGTTLGCDPILGESIYQAIRRGVTVILSSGDDELQIPSLFGDDLSLEKTSSPGCWGHYFKGAITVGSSDTQKILSNDPQIAQFSNYGETVEILAPGTGIPVLGKNAEVQPWNGSIFAAPQVSAAAALLIAIHKNREWNYYSPWLIEDLLLEGSLNESQLTESVLNGKRLNLSHLGSTIDTYNELPEAQRKAFTGAPLILEEAPQGPVDVNTLVIVSNQVSSSNHSRIQLKAKLLRPNLSLQEDMTQQVSWSVDKPLQVTINNDGVLTPLSEQPGQIVITAHLNFEGETLTASSRVVIAPQRKVTHVDFLAGVYVDNEMVNLSMRISPRELSPVQSLFLKVTEESSNAFGDIIQRDVSELATFSLEKTHQGSTQTLPVLYNAIRILDLLDDPPGTTYRAIVTYNGVTKTQPFNINQTVSRLDCNFRVNGAVVGGVTQDQLFYPSCFVVFETGGIRYIAEREKLHVSFNDPQGLVSQTENSFFVVEQDINTLTNLTYTMSYSAAETQNQTHSISGELTINPPLNPAQAVGLSIQPYVYSHFPVALHQVRGEIVPDPTASEESQKLTRRTVGIGLIGQGDGPRGSGTIERSELYRVNGNTENFVKELTSTSDFIDLDEGDYRIKGYNYILQFGIIPRANLDFEFDFQFKPDLSKRTIADNKVPLTPTRPNQDKIPHTICQTEQGNAARPFATNTQPFLICNSEQLFELRNFSSEQRLEIEIGSDLDFKNFPNRQIQESPHYLIIKGNGFKFKNFTFVDRALDRVGLFGRLQGEIHDVTFVDPFIEGQKEVGVLAGYASIRLNNISVISSDESPIVVRGESSVGTLVGAGRIDRLNGVYIENTNVTGTVGCLAGVIGFGGGTFDNLVLNQVNVTYQGVPGEGKGQVSGIAHNTKCLNKTTPYALNLFNTHFRGSVRGVGNSYGLSQNTHSVIKSSFHGSVIADAGIASMTGFETSKIVNSSFRGEISGRDGAYFFWRILGRQAVYNNYFLSSLQSSSGSVGIAASFSIGDLIDMNNLSESQRNPLLTLFQYNNKYSAQTLTASSFHFPALSFIRGPFPSNALPGNHPGYSLIPQEDGSSYPLAILSNVPLAVEKGESGFLQVSGENTFAYQAKYGKKDELNCATPAGYSELKPISESIQVSSDEMNKGDFIEVCVVGHSLEGIQQPFDQATKAHWKVALVDPVQLVNVPDGTVNIDALNIQVVGSGDISLYAYRLGLADQLNCNNLAVSDYSSFRSISQPITDDVSALTTAPVRLCVIGRTSTNQFQEVATQAIWTVDNHLGAVYAVGTPQGITKETRHQIQITGSDSSKFRHLATLNLDDCYNKENYGAAISQSTILDLDTSPLGDGTVFFCSLGEDDRGLIQNTSSVKIYTWTKDTTPPVVQAQDIPRQSGLLTTAHITPTELAQMNLAVRGEDVVSFRSQFIHKDQGGCENINPYSPLIDISNRISDGTSSLPDGEIKLCLRGQDLAGNLMPSSQASEVLFIKTTPPQPVTFSELASSILTTEDLRIKVVGHDPGGTYEHRLIADYQYKHGIDGQINCNSSTGYGAFRKITADLFVKGSDYQHNDLVRVCVLGRKGDLLSQETPSSFTFKVIEPPLLRAQMRLSFSEESTQSLVSNHNLQGNNTKFTTDSEHKVLEFTDTSSQDAKILDPQRAFKVEEEVSFSFWIKVLQFPTDNGATFPFTLGDNIQDGGFFTYLKKDGRLSVYARNNEGLKVIGFPRNVPHLQEGRWHHFAFTYKANEGGLIHIDGIPSSRREALDFGPLQSATDIIHIYKNLNGTTSSHVRMDEITFWNEALTSSEFVQIYNEQKDSFHEISDTINQDLTSLEGLRQPQVYMSMTNGVTQSLVSNHNLILDGATSTGNHLNFQRPKEQGASIAETETKLSLSKKMTASFWLRVNEFANTGNVALLSKGSNIHDANFVIYLRNSRQDLFTSAHVDGKWQVVAFPGTASKIEEREWNHVVFTYDENDGGLIYVNGTPRGVHRAVGLGALQANDSPIHLVNRFSSLVDENIDMDELMLWDVDLSQDEVKNLYERQVEKFTSGPSEQDLIDLALLEGIEKPKMYMSFSKGKVSSLVSGHKANFSGNASSVDLTSNLDGDEFITFTNTKTDSGKIDDFSRDLAFTDEMTLSFWMKAHSLAENSYAVPIRKGVSAQDLNYTVYVHNRDKSILVLGTRGGEVNQSLVSSQKDSVILGEWLHVAFSYKVGGLAKVYINGELSNSSPAQEPLATSTAALQLFGGFNPSQLDMDELVIWDKEIQANELQILYERQKEVLTGGPSRVPASVE